MVYALLGPVLATAATAAALDDDGQTEAMWQSMVIKRKQQPQMKRKSNEDKQSKRTNNQYQIGLIGR